MPVNPQKPLFFISMANSGAEQLSHTFGQSATVVRNKVTGTGASIHDSLGAKFLEQEMKGARSTRLLCVEQYGIRIKASDSGEPTIANLPLAEQFVDWLANNHFPVVHFVRENALDCLANQMAQLGITHIAPAVAVEAVRQILEQQAIMQKRLQLANRMEVKFEHLRHRSGHACRQILHEICRFTGLGLSQVELANFTMSHSDQMRFSIATIKRELRPALTRHGWENLFDLPRAA